MKENSKFVKNEIFTSKSNVLKFLKTKIKKSKIEKIVDFTVEEWLNEEQIILETVNKKFNDCLVIVRSSAIGEDSVEKSEAGNYTSIQNINSSSRTELKNAITKVIKSYQQKGNNLKKNQILIQKQSSNITTSGVAFTRSTYNSEPYYIINFEDGISTDGVTKGQQTNTIKIFREINFKKIPEKWRNLIRSFKEIEDITRNDKLDIEFGITKESQIIIFQVRPLTIIKNKELDGVDKKISKLIQQNKKKFTKLISQKQDFGKLTVFSDMSDWNPAEIIGNNPNFLDYTLYDYLIMKKAWHEGRELLGYQKVNFNSLMVKFGNKPYVDTRASFNSLIPRKLNKKLKQKLLNFYFEKLKKNPDLHDKVEFEILFTCYDLTLDNRLKELKEFGFTKIEILTIKKILLEFTNQIIKDFPRFLEECEISINKMSNNRKQIIKKLSSTNTNISNLLESTESLLKDCKKFGTVNFSKMARIAFISSILLKSLKNSGHIDAKQIENFMMSITTSTSKIQNDFKLFQSKKISKNEILEKYGHLRPGTYDITALRYDDDENKFFDNMKFFKEKKKTFDSFNEDSILRVLKKHKLNFEKYEFLNFVKQTLVYREELKFEFTKNLSDSLELIAKTGEKLGFSREEISYLDLQTILKNKNENKNNLKKIWKNKICSNIKKKILNDYFVLPPLIFSKNDFELIEYYLSKPNFITSEKITRDIIRLENHDNKIQNLENKIILIENADPGYDWIFTKNPSGLITKYGGVASHMAIRCSELGLPAAIGCGEILFEQLKNSNKVLVDCKNEQIIVLQSNIQNTDFFEEKKILKSLGYIK